MTPRDIEELLFERGMVVSYETAHRFKFARLKPGSTWHPDEMFVMLRGEPDMLWRTVAERGAELISNYSIGRDNDGNFCERDGAGHWRIQGHRAPSA